MNLRVKLIPRYLPAFMRKLILAKLMAVTAKVFECQVPNIDHLTYDKLLEKYAVFTRDHALKIIQSNENVTEVKEKLFRNTYALVKKYDNFFTGRTMIDVMTIGEILYRAISVEMHGDRKGHLEIKNCYFSQFYTCQVCDLISAIDDGIFAGLSGGGRVIFYDRITEGKQVCKAILNVYDSALNQASFSKSVPK